MMREEALIQEATVLSEEPVMTACVMVFAVLVALNLQAIILRRSVVEPAVIPTFNESPLVIVSVCGVESL